MKPRLAVLISGRGSNMQALAEAAADPAYPAELVLVLSNRADAAGLAWAAARGLPTAVVESRAHRGDRAAFEAAMQRVLTAHGVEWIALAGFMRVLTEGFVAAWQGRMINIHPSLLPAFPGLDTHARALEAGVKLHGCTVHLVSPGVDEGPILAQAAVPVRPDDTEVSLAARVLAEEHRLYAPTLARLIRGDAGRPAEGALLNPLPAAAMLPTQPASR
ncbi:MAG: phosphoribosylglycinamide formyltransferase [Acetobacteraceae bacterium]|nr:phosphoribosylglycinamide formyltransferase [Acetobacteraceae bacterium]